MTIQTATRGRVRRVVHISREMVRADRDAVFCFGDDMEGTGVGGWAAAMRGEPNVVGVPTKWRPGEKHLDYFDDTDWYDSVVRAAITEAFQRLRVALQRGHDVVIPAGGLGTSLAELPTRAPELHARIERAITRLEEEYAHAG